MLEDIRCQDFSKARKSEYINIKLCSLYSKENNQRNRIIVFNDERQVHLAAIAILNVYAANNWTVKCVKQELTKAERKIEKSLNLSTDLAPFSQLTEQL